VETVILENGSFYSNKEQKGINSCEERISYP